MWKLGRKKVGISEWQLIWNRRLSYSQTFCSELSQTIVLTPRFCSKQSREIRVTDSLERLSRENRGIPDDIKQIQSGIEMDFWQSFEHSIKSHVNDKQCDISSFHSKLKLWLCHLCQTLSSGRIKSHVHEKQSHLSHRDSQNWIREKDSFFRPRLGARRFCGYIINRQISKLVISSGTCERQLNCDLRSSP
jgi:hypothetical protein